METVDSLVIDRTLLQVVFDIVTGSMDFGSDFLDNEEVDAMRKVAELIGVDPMLGTPSTHKCRFDGKHEFYKGPPSPNERYCQRCRKVVA